MHLERPRARWVIGQGLSSLPQRLVGTVAFKRCPRSPPSQAVATTAERQRNARVQREWYPLETLAYLRERGVEAEIVGWLDRPPSDVL